MGGGFSQAGLDPLQRLDALALEKTFPSARENGFGGKTILDAKRILHDPFQPFLRFRHVYKIIARPRVRKLKNPVMSQFGCRARREECCPKELVTSSPTNQDTAKKPVQLNLSIALTGFRE
jgi:hypothetical protein